MEYQASGTFDVKLNPQPATGDWGLGRLSIDKQFYGDLSATSTGEMLSAMTGVDGSAAYVALERVSGTLHGRHGGFTLQHTGVMNRGAADLTVAVVPDSGSNELAGMAGTLNIVIDGDAHRYELTYTLPDDKPGDAAIAPDAEMPDIETGLAIPLLPCVSLEQALPFWETLGYEVTYRQKSPSLYAVIKRGNYALHFYGLKGLDPQNAFSTCVVIVPDVERLHAAFAERLRAELGKVPNAGLPRVTRMKPGQSRFTVVDPSGNSVIFVKQGPEDEAAAEEYKQAGQTPLQKAISVAARLRDFKNDDAAAAKTLDNALARYPEAAPVDRARALAARVELAVALGETDRARTLYEELGQVALTAEERAKLRGELQVAAEAMAQAS